MKKARPFSSLDILMRVKVPVVYGAGHNDFDAGNIHYESHWKGRALISIKRLQLRVHGVPDFYEEVRAKSTWGP